jgi:DNA-binding MarR family transcriptional regulator
MCSDAPILQRLTYVRNLQLEAQVTESVSGFLSPEERAALEKRKQAPEPEPSSGISLAILQILATDGPTPLSEILPKVRARPRAVLSTIDDLEQSGLVRVSAQGVDEIAELTEAGHARITS